MKRFFGRVLGTLKTWYRRFHRTMWFRLLRAAFIILVVAGVGYIISVLNIFYVEEIEIEGFADSELHYISYDELEETLTPYLGERIFTVNNSEVEDLILNEYPFTKDVYVSKRIPNILVVRIVEREPLVSLRATSLDKMFSVSESDRKHLVIVDTEGFVTATCADESRFCDDLPVCSVLDASTEYTPGDEVFFTEFDDVVELGALFSDMGIDVAGYAIPETDTVVVLFEDQTRAIFSLRKELLDQVDDFEYMRENLTLEGKTYKEIDFRYESPVLRVDKHIDWVTE